MSSIQLLADSTIYKQRVDDMNQKPLLLVFTSQELNRQESALLGRAELLWTGDKFSLAQLPVQAFNQGWRATCLTALVVQEPSVWIVSLNS